MRRISLLTCLLLMLGIGNSELVTQTAYTSAMSSQQNQVSSQLPAPAAVEPIPRMGEWALMIFGLLILNLSVFFIYKQQNAIG